MYDSKRALAAIFGHKSTTESCARFVPSRQSFAVLSTQSKSNKEFHRFRASAAAVSSLLNCDRTRQKAMEQQVAEAALAIVRPSTPQETRNAASQFLEEWNKTPQAWAVYVKWLESFDVAETSPETTGMQLLCLTLLLAKIRRELMANNSNGCAQEMEQIRNQVGSLLKSTHLSPTSPLVTPLCGCMAALAARCGFVANLVSSAGNELAPSVYLKLLGNIPPELEATSLQTSQITEALWPHLQPILDIVRSALMASEDKQTLMAALQLLRCVVDVQSQIESHFELI